MTATMQLLDEIFAPQGLLAKVFPKYELRESQREMAKKIWEAFQKEKIALIEAGTGIGKSLAYLIPAFIWSHQTGEKIVLSTYTIALQEQLLSKDIPLLVQALGINLRVMLVKGMNNYLCLRKLEQLENQTEFFEEDSFSTISSWAKETADGTKSTLPIFLEEENWHQVKAESEVCPYVKCPHFKRCFFFKARESLQDADILIVNHHLLLSHLLQEEKQPILPSFSRIILDEAHHVESVTQKALAKTLDRVEIFRSLSRIHSDHHPEVSRLYALRDLLQGIGKPSLILRLENDLPAMKRGLLEKIRAAFDIIQGVFERNSSQQKWRLPTDILENWENNSPFEEAAIALKEYHSSLNALVSDVRFLSKSKEENVEQILFDIENALLKIQDIVALMNEFFSHQNEVLWLEKKEDLVILSKANLGISTFLKDQLFSQVKTSILCSATLAANESFQFICDKLGLENEEALCALYPSPFDFKHRTKLLIPEDLPLPDAFDFIPLASKFISEAIAASGGGAFVLFTSYDMLQKCSEILQKNSSVSLFKQGDLSRHLLLEKFRQHKNGVLLGTDSFWEGVDVVGDALRLVIIVKLPFPVPSDPIFQARAEKLKKEGKDPFMEDALPYAVMKFKQGFGRLMRSSDDRGCVICLDKRLIQRFYGKHLLNNLPECMTFFGSKVEVIKELHSFYRYGA